MHTPMTSISVVVDVVSSFDIAANDGSDDDQEYFPEFRTLQSYNQDDPGCGLLAASTQVISTDDSVEPFGRGGVAQRDCDPCRAYPAKRLELGRCDGGPHHAQSRTCEPFAHFLAKLDNVFRKSFARDRRHDIPHAWV